MTGKIEELWSDRSFCDRCS